MEAREPEKVDEYSARRPDGQNVVIGIWRTFRLEHDNHNGWHSVANGRLEHRTEAWREVVVSGGQLMTEDHVPLTLDDPRIFDQH